MQPENEPGEVTAVEPVHIDREPVVVADVDRFLEEVSKRSMMMKHIIRYALEHSTENDWVLQHSQHGPVPYLQATGCEKIARLFGVRISSVVSEVTRKPNGHFVWEFMGVASLKGSPGDSIEVFGSRDSEDPFFSRRRGENVPPEQISERDVKMAAYSNFFVNAVSRLLGLRGFTVEMLQEAHLDPKKMRGVEYKGEPGGASPGATRASARRSSKSKDEPDAKAKLYSLMKQIVGPDKDKLAEFLEEITTFQGKEGETVRGVRTFKGMSDKRIQVTLGRLREDVDKGKYSLKFNEEA